jgi:hypothetical protein
MPKFTYLGVEDAADQNGTLAFGIYFPVGEAVEVDADRTHAVAKLSPHPHFRAEGAAEPAHVHVDPVHDPLDHDGDGRKGGSKKRKA